MTTGATPRFRLDIQGLRALAVTAVVLDHADIPGFAGGFVGVDVFFVISGFLITSMMLRVLDKEGRIGFGDFYARRFRRILPASLAVLMATLVAAFFIEPPLTFGETAKDAIATAAYVPNIWFALEGTDYLANPDPSLYQHYWSLGVEEQFYLVWPLLLGTAFAAFRRSRRAVLTFLIALVLLSFAACIIETPRNQPYAFFLPMTRVWELGVGAITAFLVTGSQVVRLQAAASAIAWAALAAVLATVFVYDHDTNFPGYAAVVPVLGTALAIWAGSGIRTTLWHPASILGLRPFVFVGEISYSLYLVHWPMLLLPALTLAPGAELSGWTKALLAALSVPVAWLLYQFVEQPLRHAKPLATRRPRVSIVVALTATLAAIIAAGGAGAISGKRHLYVDRAAPATSISSPPVATDFVPSNLAPSLRGAADDNPEIYTNGCHLDFGPSKPATCYYGDPNTTGPHVALFGDSHAAQWYPSLRELVDTDGIYLEVHTKSSCAAANVPRLNLGNAYTACDTWRQRVIDRLTTTHTVDTVLTSGYRRSFDDDILVDKETPSDQQWYAGLTDTVGKLTAAGLDVIDLADTPSWDFEPPACLSAHLDATSACAEPESNLILSASLLEEEERVVELAGGRYASLTPYLCGDDECPPIVGNTLVYRDRHHVTATFSRLLAPALRDIIEPR